MASAFDGMPLRGCWFVILRKVRDYIAETRRSRGVRRDSLAGVLFCNIEKEFKITSRRRGGRGACAGIRLHRGDAEVAEAGAEGRIDLAFPLENLVSDPSAISRLRVVPFLPSVPVLAAIKVERAVRLDQRSILVGRERLASSRRCPQQPGDPGRVVASKAGDLGRIVAGR